MDSMKGVDVGTSHMSDIRLLMQAEPYCARAWSNHTGDLSVQNGGSRMAKTKKKKNNNL
jgi:hypothetical protein